MSKKSSELQKHVRQCKQFILNCQFCPYELSHSYDEDLTLDEACDEFRESGWRYAKYEQMSEEGPICKECYKIYNNNPFFEIT